MDGPRTCTRYGGVPSCHRRRKCRAPDKEARAVRVAGRVQLADRDDEALYRETRTISAVYLLLHKGQRSRASGGGHGTIFPSDAAVGAPDGAHAGGQGTDRKDSRLGAVAPPADL